MKKKIGLLIDTMNSGGAQRVVSHLSYILGERYDVHVILFTNKYTEYQCQGVIHYLNVSSHSSSLFTKVLMLYQRVNKLRSLIQKERIECVISFLDSPNFVNLLANAKGCQKVISIRNYSGLENRQSTLGRIVDFAMKRLYRRADSVVTVSKLIEQDFYKHYNIPENKITTIYNPYNFDDIQELGKMPLTDAERAFYDGHFVFANVGRIMYQKGIWHLVKAFKAVHDQHPEARLVLVGEDLSNGNLVRLIGELSLHDAVLLTGRTKNPYQYMKNAQCYVLSSLFEGFPNAMVEAMACGCPIIATDCKSGPREILCEKPVFDQHLTEAIEADYGILIPELEQEENWNCTEMVKGEVNLSNAMNKIMVDSQQQQNMAKFAEKRSRVFSYRRCEEAFCEVIET